MHIIDDYVLQTVLSKLKQRDWWLDQPGMSWFYRNDYKAALLCHAFEWTGSIMILPIIYTYSYRDQLNYNTVGAILVFLFVLNTIAHYRIDDMKANLKIINLVQDQIAHFIQILFTFSIWVLSIILT